MIGEILLKGRAASGRHCHCHGHGHRRSPPFIFVFEFRIFWKLRFHVAMYWREIDDSTTFCLHVVMNWREIDETRLLGLHVAMKNWRETVDSTTRDYTWQGILAGDC